MPVISAHGRQSGKIAKPAGLHSSSGLIWVTWHTKGERDRQVEKRGGGISVCFLSMCV